MSTPIDTTKLDTCGCCPGAEEEEKHYNPPGQTELNYRIDIHPTFLKRMLERIYEFEVQKEDADDMIQSLQVLTTRETDDFAIALMDAWAMVADVFTFYEERIANEGFLRTATERRSVLELARAIGYELDPGVAAQAWLAFKVDDAEGAPTEAVVSKGTQVQSIPAGDGELPQTFETMEDFEANVRWNAMGARLEHPQALTEDNTHAYLSGTGLGLEKGDLVLLDIDTGQYPRRIREIEEDNEAQRTKIMFDAELSEPSTEVDAGDDAELDPDQEQLELTFDNVCEQVYDKTWDESELQAFLSHHEWGADDVLAYIDERRADELEGTGTLHALREKVAFFGHNAPYYPSLPDAIPGDIASGKLWPNNWDGGGWTIWTDSLTNAEYDQFHACLAREVTDLAVSSWAVLIAPSVKETYQIESLLEVSRAGFGMSSEVLALTFAGLTTKNGDFTLRDTVAHLKSEELELGTIPVDDDVAKGSCELWLESMVVGLVEGQTVAFEGEDTMTEGYIRHEILTIAAITHSRGLTKLEFNEELSYSYKRDTISINANVTLASHGEKVTGEVLGGGDGSATYQAFDLKKPPLTYVAVGTASGSESTLTVRVDGVEWSEASSLYFLDADSKSYVIRIDDDANAKVIFGDGKKGARLPSGEENIVVDYRSGIGLDGEVGADSLTLLKTRPFGIREVTNPLEAGGADDPEVLAEARDNAPLTVLTLDRIVSLQDYEDFARAYPGIGKAQAVTVWDGESEIVHVTVADSSGDEVVSPLDGYLRDAIDDARDPLRKVEIASFQPLSFYVSAKVKIDDAYVWEDVKAEVESALLEAFSFDERAFGQPVSAAGVMQVVHGIEGVVAVDLDWLDKTAPPDAPPGTSFNAVLDSQVARFDKNHTDGPRILPAQLLLIHPLGVSLTEMTT